MRSTLAELILGVGTALISVILVTGAMMMSLGEILPAPVAAGSSTQTPTASLLEQSTSEVSATPTINPSLVPHSSCATPKSWETYVIKAGDTVEKLASLYAITPDQIIRYNCLDSPILLQDTELSLPPLPPPTATASPLAPTVTPTRSSTATSTITNQPSATTIPLTECQHPAGWKPYHVRLGETLFSIGALYNTSYLIILDASCLPRNHWLIAGDILYVPNIFTSTPRVSQTNTAEPPVPTAVASTKTPRPTATDTPTAVPILPTSTPTVPPATLIPTVPTTPTATLTPTVPTATLIPTVTTVSSATLTSIPPTDTSTPIPTPTALALTTTP